MSAKPWISPTTLSARLDLLAPRPGVHVPAARGEPYVGYTVGLAEGTVFAALDTRPRRRARQLALMASTRIVVVRLRY